MKKGNHTNESVSLLLYPYLLYVCAKEVTTLLYLYVERGSIYISIYSAYLITTYFK